MTALDTFVTDTRIGQSHPCRVDRGFVWCEQLLTALLTPPKATHAMRESKHGDSRRRGWRAPRGAWRRMSSVPLLALLAVACATEHEAPPRSPASAELPRLEQVDWQTAIDDSIIDRIMKIAVDRNGRVALALSFDDNPRVRFVDSTGNLRGGAGPAGAGPGELGIPPRSFWIGDKLAAYENGRRRLILFDQDGTLVREHPLEGGLVALGRSANGVLEFDPNWRERGRPAELRLRSIADGRVRRLLGQNEPRLERSLRTDDGIPATYPWPIVTADSTTLVLVDPRDAIVWRFSLADGSLRDSVVLQGVARERGVRELAEEVEAAAQSTRGPDGRTTRSDNEADLRRKYTEDRAPIAFIHGVHFDGRGRLWIVGPHRDSTRALVVGEHGLLGAMMIPCFRVGRFVDVTDRWLAVACSNGNDADVPADLRLYRIVEP